jgi:hypothetical protein
MMRARWLPLAIVSVCAVGMLASCGGGQGERSAASRQAFAEANANCRQMLAAVKQLAKGVLSRGYSSNLELTTEGFAKPGIDLVRREAKQQQSLQAVAANPHFTLYAELFDPIIVLAEQRLRAGRAGEVARSQLLQDLLTSLGAEQRDAAHLAGLRDCDVDFLDAMVRAASD